MNDAYKKVSPKIASFASSASKNISDTYKKVSPKVSSFSTNLLNSTKTMTKNTVDYANKKIGDIAESKYMTEQIKIKNSNYKINSDDETNYELTTENIKKDAKCMVHITCDNASKIKKKIQEHICNANKVHYSAKEKLELIKEQYKNLPEDVKNETQELAKELEKTQEKLDNKRNIKRASNIDIMNDPIEIEVILKGYHDKIKGNIILINPMKNSFDISYTDSENKNKIQKNILFSELCITNPENNCELENNKCSLEGGSKNIMVGGNNSNISISTDSLC